jgi:hypothetical protein
MFFCKCHCFLAASLFHNLLLCSVHPLVAAGVLVAALPALPFLIPLISITQVPLQVSRDIAKLQQGGLECIVRMVSVCLLLYVVLY